MEAVFCREAFRLPAATASDNDFAARWLALNILLSARKPARESRAGSASLGANFLRVVLGLADLPLARRSSQCFEAFGEPGALQHGVRSRVQLPRICGRTRRAGLSPSIRSEPGVVLPALVAAGSIRGRTNFVEFEAGNHCCSQSQRCHGARRRQLLHAVARLGRDGASCAEHSTFYQLIRQVWKASATTMASVAQNAREVSPELCEPPQAASIPHCWILRAMKFTGRTVLAASRQEPPLKVVRAFNVQDGAALAHLHNVSGGLLGGDQLALKVNVGARADVQLTTTGATRIYRPRHEAPPATQSNEFTLYEDALLEYVPDAIIPYGGARFSQTTTIYLAQGAGIFWWEILAPGREAGGESFAYDCSRNENGCGRARPTNRQRTSAHRTAQTLDAIFRPTWPLSYLGNVLHRARGSERRGMARAGVRTS